MTPEIKGKRTYRLVVCMDGIWRMSKTRYTAYLRKGKKEGAASPDDYGKYLGYIDRNTTDYDEEEFKDALQDLKEADA